MGIRALIADDEPLARERIRALLASEGDIEVIGECRDGLEAVEAIRRLNPDLLFLDVEMPEVDGFGVAQAINGHSPVIIFTTAYDRYAIRAFEAHALDYLLKPFDRERFHRAVERARMHLLQAENKQLADRLMTMLMEVRERKGVERLVVRSGGRVIFLKCDEIDWVEAAANYVCLHVGKDSHLLRETMNSFEQKLDPEKFMRIHRSTIVNLEKVRALEPCNNGEYIVVLENGKELSLSRSYRDRVEVFLHQPPPHFDRRIERRA